MALFKKKSPAQPLATVQDSVFQASTLQPARPVRHGTARRWSIAGALIGLVGALVLFAPASWLARSLASGFGEFELKNDLKTDAEVRESLEARKTN